MYTSFSLLSSLPSICIAFLFVTAANCQAAWPSRGSPYMRHLRKLSSGWKCVVVVVILCVRTYKKIISCPSRFADHLYCAYTTIPAAGQCHGLNMIILDFHDLYISLYTGCLPRFFFFLVNERRNAFKSLFLSSYIHKLNCLHSVYLYVIICHA